MDSRAHPLVDRPRLFQLIKDITMAIDEDLRYQSAALSALGEAVDMYTVLFFDFNRIY